LPSKYNNDKFIELVLGITFGILAMILVWVTIKTGNFTFLINSWEGNHSKSRLHGIPAILFIMLGFPGLYYSLKEIFKANIKKSDT
jgi:uncharacterized BrkB/YihY/UPF0761 family membrane protein